ncbi:MAG: ATP-binding protein, partial [Spirochaetaceae bacterium]|nr:ATP-binding protein [Spirochaetaceae bacterium]
MRFNQNSILKDLRTHNNFHRSAVSISNRLRYEAEVRWSFALQYYLNRNENILVSIKKSEKQTNIYFNELNELGINESFNRTQVEILHTMSMFNSHKLTYNSYMALYHQFLEAIENGESEKSDKLFLLLAHKYQILKASLDDLVIFHEITEKKITEDLSRSIIFFDIQLFSFLGFLILGGFFLLKYQTFSIINPIKGLTESIGQIELGKEIDLSIFNGDDEIGQLSSAFLSMINTSRAASEEIKKQNIEISRAYSDVEIQVKARTEELEKLEVQTQKLEAINNDLESFSYAVSHDLRAPLRAIDGYISLLQEDYGQNFDEEERRLFDVVRNNAVKMGHLIDDILAISRAGRIDLEYQLVDMKHLVGDIWNDLSEDRKDHPIDFHLGDLHSVQCDLRVLRQVWQNLIGNAIKFTRLNPHARISIRSEKIVNAIEYTIEDNGVGFNPEYSKKLFLLFQRLHSNSEFEGTGVGLALIQKFIQKHNGSVKGSSVLNKGATFSFTLPLENLSV